MAPLWYESSIFMVSTSWFFMIFWYFFRLFSTLIFALIFDRFFDGFWLHFGPSWDHFSDFFGIVFFMIFWPRFGMPFFRFLTPLAAKNRDTNPLKSEKWHQKNYRVTTLRLPRRRLVPHRPLSLHFFVIFQDFRINFKNLHDFLWNLTLLEAIWKIFWMNFLLHWRPNASKRIISSLGPERALPQALRSAPGPQAPRACLDLSRAPSSFLFFF